MHIKEEEKIVDWLKKRGFQEACDGIQSGKIGFVFEQLMKGHLVLVATSEGRMSSSEVTFAYLPLTGSIWVAPKVVTFLFAPFSTRNVSRLLLEHLRIFPA